MHMVHPHAKALTEELRSVGLAVNDGGIIRLQEGAKPEISLAVLTPKKGLVQLTGFTLTTASAKL